jgi:BMFP domain-containing protein YqiC
MSELAEKLRDWMEARIKARAAYEALIEMDADAEYFTDDTARAYLRGHDDRQSEIDALAAEVEKWKGQYYAVADAVARESTGVVDLCRKARQTREDRDALTARVRELEAQLAAQPQPAAVGVVGAVRWGILMDDRMYQWTYSDKAAAHAVKHVPSSQYRVVAIVDPEQIVELASAEPAAYTVNGYPSQPLYPGRKRPAQPAQERGA